MAPCHGATPAQTYYGSPVKLEKYGNAGSWGQLWEESAMVAEEDWCWDLNPGMAAIWGFLGPRSFGKSWDHAALGCALFAAWLRKQERVYLEEKG